MNPASISSVPPVVELAIYGYFLLVAAIGCYINGRLWLGNTRSDEESGDGTNPSH